MTRQLMSAEAINLLVRSVNILLAANGAPYRVTSDDITMIRRDGFTLVALRETRQAADLGSYPRPFSTLEGQTSP